MTAAKGFPYISNKAEAQIAGVTVLEVFAKEHNNYDAAIIAAFGDPGLIAARELFEMPMVALHGPNMMPQAEYTQLVNRGMDDLKRLIEDFPGQVRFSMKLFDKHVGVQHFAQALGFYNDGRDPKLRLCPTFFKITESRHEQSTDGGVGK